jgi:hypothetical protein
MPQSGTAGKLANLTSIAEWGLFLLARRTVQRLGGSCSYRKYRASVGAWLKSAAEPRTECPVVDRAANLEQEIGTSPGPSHLLRLVHSPSGGDRRIHLCACWHSAAQQSEPGSLSQADSDRNRRGAYDQQDRRINAVAEDLSDSATTAIG